MALRLLLAAYSFIAVVAASSPLIDTKYGQLEGFTTKLQDSTEAAVFLGVPYAQPPVGELRLELLDL
ncbi:carboxylesterase [Aphelenchoides avenae]|nr:carboxylesterase [Aphelenchus avenae]